VHSAVWGEAETDVKGLILSGGKGTRLRPLTYTSAKQLVPVANKPVLFYGIEAIAAAGIREIGIVVGDTQAEIRAAVGDGSRWGVRVEYIEQEAPLGLAHAVKISQPFIGTDPFVMYLGDNLLNKGITHFVEEFAREKPAAQILLARVPDPQMFGVAELRNGTVVRLVEKPKEPIGDLALVGVYMFGSEVFESVNRITPSVRNELEITDAIQDLIDRGLTVRPHIVDGWWKDTGKLEDMLEANRLILEIQERRIDGSVDGESRIEGKVVIEAGAVVERSVIRGPAIIGRGARIVQAYIVPFTSIMNDVEILDSEIEHSIVLEGSSVRDLSNRVIDSLIGRNVRIYRIPVKPSAYRFMLGDNSEVGIRW
jgi:glucose-1-phosphate thymidylyltransferase